MLDENEFYLTLVRHGQSTTNANPDLMGQDPDVELTEKGIMQATLLANRLVKSGQVIDLAFSSPYTRALHTAQIVCQTQTNPPLIGIAPAIREYSAGDWNNASRSKTITPAIRNKMALLPHVFLPPGGESMHQVTRRASEWLENTLIYSSHIQALAQEKKKRQEILNIFCFSHGMTIKCLLHYITGFDQSFTWKLDIQNTSMSKLYFGPEGWRLLGINDHAHLEQS
jgi:broad specificity phosphatase PhoE